MANELVLKYDDLCDKSTYTFAVVNNWTQEIKRYQDILDRLTESRDIFIYYLQERKELTDEQYRCYKAWTEHSNISPAEIFQKYVED